MNLYCSQCGKVHAYRRPQAEPEHESRLMLGLAVIGEALAMAVLLLVLLFGVPFVIWLVAS